MHPAVSPQSFGLLSTFFLLHLQIAPMLMVIVSLSGPLKEVTCTSARWKFELTKTEEGYMVSN